MTIPILKTKLYLPPEQARVVPRPRLLARLDDGLRPGCALVLVSAPAGFGKTTLVSAWLHRRGGVVPPTGEDGMTPLLPLDTPLQVAWLSLDQGDNDPVRFLAYLAAAVRSAGVQLGPEVLAAIQSPQPSAGKGLLVALLNDLAEQESPLVLVLDDYHEITAEPVHETLVFLLDHLPSHAHLVLTTRIDPPWPLARLRARQAMIELRAPDLRFTLEEAATYLNDVMGLGLSAQNLAALDRRTEGWISGLQMAALAMQASAMQASAAQASSSLPDQTTFIQDFGGSHRFVLDYLVEEVLERQPDEVQAFLLQTSILDRLSAPLCDALLECAGLDRADSRERLVALERANLFVVPLDGERRWYRYHRLFADLLRARLQRTQPAAQTAALHLRASVWLEQNDLIGAAIDHALEGGDLERAADLVEQSVEAMLMRGEVVTFWRWADALPESLLRVRPRLCLYYSLTLLWRGRSQVIIESLLKDVRRGERDLPGGEMTLRSLLAAFQGDISLAVELAQRALALLPPEERFARSYLTWIQSVLQLSSASGDHEGRALDDVLDSSRQAGNILLEFMVECNRAELWMRQGRLERSAVTYRRALERISDVWGPRPSISGQALVGLGELARLRGDLEDAARRFEEGIHLLEQWTQVGPLEGYMGLARVLWALGERARAWAALDKARALAADYDLTELDDLSVALIRAAFWIDQGDLQAAQRWAESRELIQYIDVPLREEADISYEDRVRKYELPVLARLLLAQGRPAEALRALEPLPAIAEWRGRPGLLIEVYALQALAWQALGEPARALDALERALVTGEPEGYVRPLLDEGQPMRALLAEFRTRIAGRSGAASLRAYVERLLGAEESKPALPAGVSSDAQPSALVEPLSEREFEVLRLLNTPLSQPEIADRLYVSINTVRSHVKHIYEKLGVHARSAAVERAEEIGLL